MVSATSAFAVLVCVFLHTFCQQVPLFADTSSLRLISVSPDSDPKWMTQKQVFRLYKSNTKFIDVTDGDFEDIKNNFADLSSSAFPSEPAQKDLVTLTNSLVDLVEIKKFLVKFTAFPTRYFRSSSGKKSSQWLYEQVGNLGIDYANKEKVVFTVEKFLHPWGQVPIVITSVDNDVPCVVLSAHQDSVNQYDPYNGISPGADDNGSGSATVFEALRVMLKNEIVPKVVASYLKNKRKVFANYHNDMTGYVSGDTVGPVVGIVVDYVNLELVKTLEWIVQVYSGIGFVHTACGYACSDHATWTHSGVPSVFTFEGEFAKHSPFIHTSQDTVEHISFVHLSAFVKTVVGFAIEMSMS